MKSVLAWEGAAAASCRWVPRPRHLAPVLVLAANGLWAKTQARAPAVAPPLSAVQLENVRVFDSRFERLPGPQNVLVVGNTIESVSATPITPPADAQLTRVDGGSRTLMPGLVDPWGGLMRSFNATRQLSLLTLAALTTSAALAQAGPAATSKVPDALMQKVSATVDGDGARLQEIFKDLHANPELGFMETRTAGIVAKELAALGYEVKTGIGKTGVVGILRNGPGPVVMYRADMDANAVEEDTGLPYESKVRVKLPSGPEVPVAHLCGHDAHTTWLLGVAKAMTALKADWKGTLVLVAQPAEEMILGAQAMVDDGLYTTHAVPKPDYLIGLHTSPIPTGAVGFKPGDFNAGTDQLDVTFHGVGGHGSSPHLTKDPVLMAASAVVQYQFIVSRAIDPLRAAVITVGSIKAGEDNNVIPASSLVKINLRWYDEADRKLMLEGIERINQSIASAYGLPAELKPTTVMKGGSKVLSNDAGMAAAAQPVLQALLGEKAVITGAPKLMGSEDFHHLVLGNDKGRYLYMFVGTAKPAHFAKAQAEGKQVPYSNHNPDYQVDLDAIALGSKVGTVTVLQFMGQAATQ